MRRSFEIPIYGSNLTVVVGTGSMKAIAARHKLPDPEVSQARATVYEAHLGKPRRPNASKARWVVILHPDADVNTIAHEAFHAAIWIAQWHLLPLDLRELDVNHEEPLAYLCGWVAERCQEVLDEYNG